MKRGCIASATSLKTIVFWNFWGPISSFFGLSSHPPKIKRLHRRWSHFFVDMPTCPSKLWFPLGCFIGRKDSSSTKDGKTMIIVEEKIDGANLGISLTDAWHQWLGPREMMIDIDWKIRILCENICNMDMEWYEYVYVILCTSSAAQGGGGSFKDRKPIGEVSCCDALVAERIHWWTERWLELCFLEWLQWLQWSPQPQLLDVVWCSAAVVLVVV